MARRKGSGSDDEAPRASAAADAPDLPANDHPADDGPSLFPDAEVAPVGKPAEGGYVVLARKYRPETFDALIGQEAMVTTLRNAFAADRIAQGYMLTGVRGVGKTTTARILARALNYVKPGEPDRPTVEMDGYGAHCEAIIQSRHPDVIEIDAASNTGVDNVREIIESARYKPMAARYKVFIIDEVHMLSKGAFNALLKTLEEPPPHVKFIFATTEVRKVPVTVLSRCQRFDLRRVEVPVLAEHFRRIAAEEGATIEDEALLLIARAAEGSVRDGLSILDQAIAMGEGRVTAPTVRAMLGLADRGRIYDLIEHTLAGRTAEALAALDGLYRDGADPLEVLGDLAEAVHAATRIKVAGAATEREVLSGEELRRASLLAERLSIPLLARVWQMLLKGLDEAGRAPDPRAAAEMVVIRIAHTADLPSPDEIIRTLGGVPASRRSDAKTPAETGSAAGKVEARAAPPPRAVAQAAVAQATEQPADDGADEDRFAPPIDEIPDAAAALDIYDESEAEDDDLGPSTIERPEDIVLNTFEDVVNLVGRKRDVRLKVHLEEHVSLVKFDPAAAIELHLLEGAPPEIANELREKLNKWTARRWTIALSRRPGERPLGEKKRAEEAAEIEALKQHPSVRAVLEHFPGAEIASVRPIAAPRSDEREEEPGEDSAVG
ncbi:MAG: DNA polymerase III subunit gamma/tau [Hyphomicrobiaceae bacterium]